MYAVVMRAGLAWSSFAKPVSIAAQLLGSMIVYR
jgi:hypothetical protein